MKERYFQVKTGTKDENGNRYFTAFIEDKELGRIVVTTIEHKYPNAIGLEHKVSYDFESGDSGTTSVWMYLEIEKITAYKSREELLDDLEKGKLKYSLVKEVEAQGF